MKKLLIACIAAAFCGAPALAADMAVKAPPPAPVAVSDGQDWDNGPGYGSDYDDFSASSIYVRYHCSNEQEPGCMRILSTAAQIAARVPIWKQCRCGATRYDKLAVTYLAFINSH